MSGRISILMTGVIAAGAVFFAGCGPQADLTLKFSPDDTAAYKVITKTVQDYDFQQPSLNKRDKKQTLSQVETVFDQKIVSITEQGDAVAEITLKSLAIHTVDKNEEKYDFDSSRDSDKSKPLARLIGQSYRIRISPSGSVKTEDAAKIRSILTSGYDGQVAKSILSDDAIKTRHEILGLPEEGKTALSKGQSYSKIRASHPKMLAPKSYEKVYTLKDIKKKNGSRIAQVVMNAVESAVPAKDLKKTSSSMSFFAKMFDLKESYTGTMEFDLDSGRVLEAQETLNAVYTAADEPSAANEDKAPDSLTMGFTYTITMELLK